MRKPKAVLILSVFLSIFLSFSFAADQPDFPDIYIDEGCAGTHVGSLANPYDDLADINWTTGGDNSIFDYLADAPSQSPTIHLNMGDEWREKMTIGCSGTATYPIIITSYGSGADPIINGADLVTTWSDEGGDIWSATLTTEPSQVFFDGTRGVNDLAPDAEFDWYWDTNVLYCYSTEDPDTAYTSPGVEASVRTRIIDGNDQNYLTFDGVHLKYSKEHGLYNRDDADNIIDYIIQNCTSEYHYRNGINLKIDASSKTITGVSINNNVVRYNGPNEGAGSLGYGILIEGKDANSAVDVQVYQNTINNNALEAIRVNAGDGCDIYKNTCMQNGCHPGRTTSEIMLDSLSNANRIYRNWMEKVGGGECVFIGSGAVSTGAHEIFYNVMINDGVGGGSGGVSIAYSSDHDCKIYNNVFYGVDGGITLGGADPINGTVIKNNIFDNLDHQNIRTLAGSTCTSDYNRFDENQGFQIDGVAKTFAEWKTATGQDGNSTEGDPVFIDVANDNYRLNPHSPCVNAGADVSLTTDYAGQRVRHTPDIGAYENQANALFMSAIPNPLIFIIISLFTLIAYKRRR